MTSEPRPGDFVRVRNMWNGTPVRVHSVRPLGAETYVMVEYPVHDGDDNLVDWMTTVVLLSQLEAA